MKIIICGAGNVGLSIAQRLSSEKNDVSVIDSSVQLIQNISDTNDVRGFVGSGSDPDILQKAGAPDADMIIAVTHCDEVNMVACQVAHSLFKIPTKIARIGAKGYLHEHWSDLFSRDNMPIDVVISPERETSDVVMRRLGLPGTSDAVNFCNGQVAVIGVICGENCPVVDTPLLQLTTLFPDLKAVVVGIMRDGNIFVPHSSDHMLIDDEVYITASIDQVQRILSIFGYNEQLGRRIIIFGGGSIGFNVAQLLEDNTRLKLIELSHERAIEIADKLIHTVVLQGSALDENILREANVENADMLLALTNDDQVNIISSVMGRRLGCRHAMALINNSSYFPFLRSLGIDSYIDPRAVTVSKILRHIRRGRILAVHTIYEGKVEILEAEVMENSPLQSKRLRELDMSDGLRIGAIYRNGEVIIPRGETQIQVHDRIVIFAMTDEVKRVEQMFRISSEFF